MFLDQQNYIRLANRIGIFLVVLFAICFGAYYARSVEPELHVRLLRLSFVGFTEMNFTGFILGAVQSYIWAYIFLGIWRLAGYCCGNKKQ